MPDINVKLERELAVDYTTYALMTYVRQIPSLVDGLRSASRRVIWAAQDLGLRSTGSFKKCARLDGHVTGRFSPHGSAYGTIANLSETHTTALNLLDFHGNLGGGRLSSDPPAAARYTEVKLHSHAEQLLLFSDAIEMRDNYDGSTKEPVLLPSRIPIILTQYITGIAVGQSSNWLPYCPTEVRDACVAYLKTGDLPEYFKPAVPGSSPLVMDEKTLETLKTGRGTIRYRCTVTKEKLGKTEVFVITDLPPGTTSEGLTEELAEKLGDRLKAVSDESDMKGIRIVVTPKSRSNLQIEELPIIKSVSINQTAIAPGSSIPKTYTVSDVIKEWTNWRLAHLERDLKNKLAEAEAELAKRLMLKRYVGLKLSPYASKAELGKHGFSAPEIEIIHSTTIGSLQRLKGTSEVEELIRKLRRSLKDLKRSLVDDLTSLVLPSVQTQVATQKSVPSSKTTRLSPLKLAEQRVRDEGAKLGMRRKDILEHLKLHPKDPLMGWELYKKNWSATQEFTSAAGKKARREQEFALRASARAKGKLREFNLFFKTISGKSMEERERLCKKAKLV